MSLGFAEMTDEQRERVEALRRRLDSAYGTDPAHWVAAAEMILGGVLDDLLAEARRDALDPLVNATDFQTEALSAVIAADVWNEHKGRTADWADLGPVTQEVQRRTARRHLEALGRFLSR